MLALKTIKPCPIVRQAGQCCQQKKANHGNSAKVSKEEQ